MGILVAELKHQQVASPAKVNSLARRGEPISLRFHGSRCLYTLYLCESRVRPALAEVSRLGQAQTRITIELWSKRGTLTPTQLLLVSSDQFGAERRSSQADHPLMKRSIEHSAKTGSIRCISSEHRLRRPPRSASRPFLASLW